MHIGGGHISFEVLEVLRTAMGLPNNVYLCDNFVVLTQNWCKNYWSEYIKMYTNPVLKLKIDTQKQQKNKKTVLEASIVFISF